MVFTRYNLSVGEGLANGLGSSIEGFFNRLPFSRHELYSGMSFMSTRTRKLRSASLEVADNLVLSIPSYASR